MGFASDDLWSTEYSLDVNNLRAYFAKNIKDSNYTSFVSIDGVYDFYKVFENLILDSMSGGSEIELYAVWKNNIYEVIFDGNKNEGSTDIKFVNNSGNYDCILLIQY